VCHNRRVIPQAFPPAGAPKTRRSAAPKPMRISVFARRSNPLVDPPILRKTLAYGEIQVAERLADWVDAADKSRGIICREFLPRVGEVTLPPTPESPSLPSAEVPGSAFRMELTEAGRDLRRFTARNLRNRRSGKFVSVIYVQQLPPVATSPKQFASI
jgi:hypothetical protein